MVSAVIVERKDGGVISFIAPNGSEIDLVANLKTKNYDNRKTVFRSTEDC